MTNAVAKYGTITYLRGNIKIKTTASNRNTATNGCNTVALAPPPNLMLSGSTFCLRMLEAQRQPLIDQEEVLLRLYLAK